MVMKVAEYKNCTIDTSHVDGSDKIYFDKSIDNPDEINYVVSICYAAKTRDELVKLMDRIVKSFTYSEFNECIEQAIKDGTVELYKGEEE